MDNKKIDTSAKKLNLRRKEVLPLKSGLRAGSAGGQTSGSGGSGTITMFC